MTVSRSPKALAKRYSNLKPTRAKLQNQNWHRRVAKRYYQVEPAQPARKKTIQLSEYTSIARPPNNNQLGESWIGLAKLAKRWKTWFELGENLSLTKFKPTRAK